MTLFEFDLCSNLNPFFQDIPEFFTPIDPEDRTQGTSHHPTCESDPNSEVEEILERFHDDPPSHGNDQSTHADQSTLIYPDLKTNFMKCVTMYSCST